MQLQKQCSGDIFVCLGSLILSFTCNFFAYFKFQSNLGRVIGKIKQNELDCRDTAPLIKVSFKVNKGNTFGDFGYCPLNRGCALNTVSA